MEMIAKHILEQSQMKVGRFFVVSLIVLFLLPWISATPSTTVIETRVFATYIYVIHL
jgi:hypothetical protein